MVLTYTSELSEMIEKRSDWKKAVPVVIAKSISFCLIQGYSAD